MGLITRNSKISITSIILNNNNKINKGNINNLNTNKINKCNSLNNTNNLCKTNNLNMEMLMYKVKMFNLL